MVAQAKVNGIEKERETGRKKEKNTIQLYAAAAAFSSSRTLILVCFHASLIGMSVPRTVAALLLCRQAVEDTCSGADTHSHSRTNRNEGTKQGNQQYFKPEK
eukprot:gene11029-7665_t